MVSTGFVTIGSHTHTHALLDRLPPDRVEDEITRSAGLIEDKLGEATARLDDASVRRDHLAGRMLSIVPGEEREAVAQRLSNPAGLDVPSPDLVDRRTRFRQNGRRFFFGGSSGME